MFTVRFRPSLLREIQSIAELLWNAIFKLLFQIGEAPNRVKGVKRHLELPVRVFR